MKKILAVDIGGTNCRFAHFHGAQLASTSLSANITFQTQSFNGFVELLNQYEQSISPPFLALMEYDALVFSVAGPVMGKKCRMPNVSWEVDLSDLPVDSGFLVNDFVAQSYACLLEDIRNQFVEIKPGTPVAGGNLAIVGAGTGLGHCCIVSINSVENTLVKLSPVASEAGHAQFPLQGQWEIELGEFIKQKRNIPYIYADAIVSGPGLSLLHEFLHGEVLTPEQAAAQFKENSDVLEWFARFYGRACRNYCLNVFASGGLVISGGVAAKNPGVVRHQAFIDEFLLSPTHQQMLQGIPVYLNLNENIGLLGAVNYGLNELQIQQA